MRGRTPVDRRIEAIDKENDGTLIVMLRPGFAYQDAGTSSACHLFGAETTDQIKQTMKGIAVCDCADCKQALASGKRFWS